MIDTNEIKNHWNNFEFGLVLDVDESTIFALFHDLKTLMKSHDELERKLKIAEDALSFYAEQETWMQKEVNGGELMSRADIFGGTVAFKALKQIRGEE